MTAQRHPAPFATPPHPEIIRLRALLVGSERARGLLLDTITAQDRELAALRTERDALRLLCRRGRVGWGDRLGYALVVAWDRLTALRDPRHRLSAHERLAILAVIAACVGLIVRLGV